MGMGYRYIYARNDGQPAQSYPFGQSPYSSGWTLIRTPGKQGPELGGKTLGAEHPGYASCSRSVGRQLCAACCLAAYTPGESVVREPRLRRRRGLPIRDWWHWWLDKRTSRERREGLNGRQGLELWGGAENLKRVAFNLADLQICFCGGGDGVQPSRASLGARVVCGVVMVAAAHSLLVACGNL